MKVKCKNCKFLPNFINWMFSGLDSGGYKYSEKYMKWGFCKNEEAVGKSFDLNSDKNIFHNCTYYKRKIWKFWVKGKK